MIYDDFISETWVIIQWIFEIMLQKWVESQKPRNYRWSREAMLLGMLHEAAEGNNPQHFAAVHRVSCISCPMCFSKTLTFKVRIRVSRCHQQSQRDTTYPFCQSSAATVLTTHIAGDVFWVVSGWHFSLAEFQRMFVIWKYLTQKRDRPMGTELPKFQVDRISIYMCGKKTCLKFMFACTSKIEGFSIAPPQKKKTTATVFRESQSSNPKSHRCTPRPGVALGK